MSFGAGVYEIFARRARLHLVDNQPSATIANCLRLIANSQHEPVLSLVSLWEIQLKLQIGKLQLNQPLDFVVAEQQRVNGLRPLPLAAEHIYGLSQLPFHHKDPFDRLLIAQAIYENLPLMSVDNAFSAYPVQGVW